MSTARKGKTKRATIEELLEELRSVVGEAEELLGAADEDSDGPFERIRERVEDSMARMKERLDDAEGLGERAKSAGRAADSYVRDNPWAAVAIAVGLGYLIGRAGRRD